MYITATTIIEEVALPTIIIIYSFPNTFVIFSTLILSFSFYLLNFTTKKLSVVYSAAPISICINLIRKTPCSCHYVHSIQSNILGSNLCLLISSTLKDLDLFLCSCIHLLSALHLLSTLCSPFHHQKHM